MVTPDKPLVTVGILPRYVAWIVAVAVVLASAALLALYTMIDLVRESGSLRGDYGITQLLWYLVLTLPARLYDIFPFAALIGALMALARLAGGHEIVAMRAGGFDRPQIAAWSLAAALALGALVMAMAETVLPELDSRARIDREQARAGRVALSRAGDVWLRDGAMMINIQAVTWGERENVEFAGITIYELDPTMKPRRILYAVTGRHTGRAWELEPRFSLDLDAGNGTGAADTVLLESRLNPEIFSALATRPRMMALADLSRMTAYLESNELNADAYREAYWRRLFYPAGILAMMIVGMPMVFRPGREHSRGLGVFIGIALGLGFFVVNRMTLGLTGVWPLPIWLSSMTPSLLFAGLGYWLLRRR